VTDEESLKAFLRKDLVSYFEIQALDLSKYEFREALIEANKVDLPEQFLRKWIEYSHPEESKENLAKTFDSNARFIRWMLLRDKIASDHEIAIEPDEVRNAIRHEIMGYFTQYGYYDFPTERLNDMTEEALQSKERVSEKYNTLLGNKVMDKAYELISTEPHEITREQYRQILDDLNEKQSTTK